MITGLEPSTRSNRSGRGENKKRVTRNLSQSQKFPNSDRKARNISNQQAEKIIFKANEFFGIQNSFQKCGKVANFRSFQKKFIAF